MIPVIFAHNFPRDWSDDPGTKARLGCLVSIASAIVSISVIVSIVWWFI